MLRCTTHSALFVAFQSKKWEENVNATERKGKEAKERERMDSLHERHVPALLASLTDSRPPVDSPALLPLLHSFLFPKHKYRSREAVFALC